MRWAISVLKVVKPVGRWRPRAGLVAWALIEPSLWTERWTGCAWTQPSY